jgi:hypothetical protein
MEALRRSVGGAAEEAKPSKKATPQGDGRSEGDADAYRR